GEEPPTNGQKEVGGGTGGPPTPPPASLPQMLGGPAVLQTSRRLRSRRCLEGLQPCKPGAAQSSLGAVIGTATLARIRSDKAWTKNSSASTRSARLAPTYANAPRPPAPAIRTTAPPRPRVVASSS